MSPPIFNPDGSEVSEIVLPDGSTASEVIGPDGNVVFEAGADIPDSGVLKYGFNEGSGTTATDSFGSNDGAINGASFTTTSAEGSHALSFDGNVGENVDSSLVPDTTNNFSWAVRFKTSFPTTDSEEAHILSTNDGNDGVSIAFSSGDLRVEGGGGVESDNTSSISGLGDGVYHSAIITFDGSNITLAIDGTRQLTESIGTFDSGVNLRVGERARSSSTSPFNGLIDDVRVYDKALTETEESNLASTGSIQ
jgi:hypothetical protein